MGIRSQTNYQKIEKGGCRTDVQVEACPTEHYGPRNSNALISKMKVNLFPKTTARERHPILPLDSN
eukprot:scaffold72966_cov37-Cyclotella_meneghiniana.AAC.1